MKVCKNALLQVHMLAEGETTPAAAEHVSEHLRSCAKCSAEFEELAGMKGLIERTFAARLPDRDSTTEIMNRVAVVGPVEKSRRRRRPLFRRLVGGAAACAAAMLLAVYFFGYFYFQKTFSFQLSETVLRCSAGIERKHPGGQWERLRVGDRMTRGTAIRTPAGIRSFMSFDGIRLLSEGEAQFEAQGLRGLLLKEGALFVATAEREMPATINSAEVVVQSSGDGFRIARSEEATTIAVASGGVSLAASDGRTHDLARDQAVTIRGKVSAFKPASAEVSDPFARYREAVIDRIKQRFTRVLSRYAPDYQLTRRRMDRSGPAGVLDMWTRPEEMLQFASYAPVASRQHAQADTRALGEYYESLFVPSNRSILIGKEKLIPLERGNAPSYPIWSHDGSMIAYVEYSYKEWPAAVRVARLDDLDHPWVISQEDEAVLPFFPVAWSPDDQHVFFMVASGIEETGRVGWWNWLGPFKIKIASINPSEGPIRDFKSPFHDIEFPIKLQVPLGKTIAPHTLKLPWGDALLCVNWGNIAYVPLEQDGQSVENAPGLFLTDFNQYKCFVGAAVWAPSGSKIAFAAIENLNLDSVNVYILYGVEDILDGFTPPPRSVHDPRIKRVAPIENDQLPSGFSFDESLVFFQEDVNNVWTAFYPMSYGLCDFDLFYANAMTGEPGMPTQIHLPDSQVGMKPSPEGNRIAYCNYEIGSGIHNYELRVVSFDIEAEMDADLGGVLIDNSGTTLIVPPGALGKNFKVKISTPFSITDEAEILKGESRFFAMRLLDAQGLEKPRFIEPMTLTIRYTDDEVGGLDEGMLEIYYYDDSDPGHPVWTPLGGTVDPEHNEITVEIRHFSKFSVGKKVAP
ncbi:hypothetical protein HZA56_14835 [Candidatus Poribacteria bacterium]|nr:hypothetical protein [Candidatus Poribacteria bacterium]